MTHEREHVIIHKLKEIAANPKVRHVAGYVAAFLLGALIF